MSSTDNSRATSIETNQYIENSKYTTKEAIDKFVNLLILGRYTEKDLSDALNYCLIRNTENYETLNEINEAIEVLKKDSEAFKIFQDNTNKLLDAIQEINNEQNTEINKINEFLKTVVTTDTEQTITGVKTFNKIYVSDPTENKQAANAQYVIDYVRNQLNLTIGDLNNLKTESKNLIVNAINDVLDALNAYKEAVNETTINQLIDTKLNPVILRVTTLESTFDYVKELAEENKRDITNLNTTITNNNKKLEEAVFYSKIDDTRKTIQLKNYDSISGLSTTGVGFNIVMVSKWDKVDLGSSGISINLNGSETRPTYNDSKEIALMDDVNTKADASSVYNKSEIDSKFETFTPGSGGSNIDTDAVNNLIKQATDPINTNVNTLLNNQGNLESLSTQNKNDLVSAINEINNKQVSVNIPEPDNTSIKIIESKYTAVKADVDTYGIILPDNDTIYFDSGKIKAKQTEIDATTIEKNDLGKLKISDNIIKSISDLDLKVQNLEQNIGGSGSGTPTPVEIKKATSSTFGIVKPDNNTIVIQDGVISANIVQEKATNNSFGIVTGDKKTINISNGIISVVDHTTKLSQLKDINSLDSAESGMVLTKTESGFEFRKLGEATNNRKTFTVNNTDFAKVYDFNQHYNVALYAIVKLRASGEEPFEVKYTSSLGDSFTEQINTYKARQLTADDLDCILYIKGKCTAVIDIFSRY